MERPDRGRRGRSPDRSERQERAERVVHVEDVEASTPELAVERVREPCPEGHERLRSVHVERKGAADVDDLEVPRRTKVRVDRPRRDCESRRQHRHVVPPPRELRGLAVDVLGDPPELRVVVVADDPDLHGSVATLRAPA